MQQTARNMHTCPCSARAALYCSSPPTDMQAYCSTGPTADIYACGGLETAWHTMHRLRGQLPCVVTICRMHLHVRHGALVNGYI